MKAQIRGRKASCLAVVALYGLVAISNLETAGMTYLLCVRVRLSLQVEWASVVNLAVGPHLYSNQAVLQSITTI